MKDLTDYPTPETDELSNRWDTIPRGQDQVALWELCESLERRLAACRETLAAIANCGQSRKADHWEFRCWARNLSGEALSLTTPLAELKP